MAEIIDILSTPLGGGGQFTVDITELSVPMTCPAGPTVIEAGNGTYRFERGDNFIVLSAGYVVPESFTMAAYSNTTLINFPLPMMLFEAIKSGGGLPIPLQEIGNNGVLRIPFHNYEISMGIFVDPESNLLTDPKFSLELVFPFIVGAEHPMISMIGVPSDLDGMTFDVIPFVKVMHNEPLT